MKAPSKEFSMELYFLNVSIAFCFWAKVERFCAPNKSLQALQRFGNEKDTVIIKRIEKGKSLQTLQRFAGGGKAP
jgi:hypothetical protein